MIENKTIGVYYVDTTDLEGWTNETLAEALREPLGQYGISVEIGNRLNNPVIFDEGEYTEDTLRDIVKHVVEKVVTQ